MKKDQVLDIILSEFGKKPFHYQDLHNKVTKLRFHTKTTNTYKHVIHLVNEGICVRVARGYYAVTEKGLALKSKSIRDKTAHAFLQEILNQKAEQDLINFQIKTIQDRLNDLQNRSYEADSKIDSLTTQLLNTVTESN